MEKQFNRYEKDELCIEHAERISKVETQYKEIKEDTTEINLKVDKILNTLQNGLSSDVKTITKKIDEHLVNHKEKVDKRQKTWVVPFISSLMGGAITFIFILILFKLGVR